MPTTLRRKEGGEGVSPYPKRQKRGSRQAGNQQKAEQEQPEKQSAKLEYSGKQSTKLRARSKPAKRTASEAAAHARTLQKVREFVLKRIAAKKEADLVLNFAISSSAPKNVELAR